MLIKLDREIELEITGPAVLEETRTEPKVEDLTDGAAVELDKTVEPLDEVWVWDLVAKDIRGERVEDDLGTIPDVLDEWALYESRLRIE